MIAARLAGWERRVQGTHVHLVAPEGPAAGEISIEERFEPPVSLVDVARVRGRLLEGPTTIDGGDGEPALLVALERPIERGGGREDIGLVIGDVHYTVIIGRTTLAEHVERTRAAVRALSRQVGLAAGVRRRRFVYGAPRGWQAVARGLETEWYSPELCRDPARLTILPAIEHCGAGAEDVLATLVEEQRDVAPRFAGAEWTDSMTANDAGLVFLRARVEAGGGLVAELAAAVDARYLYAFRLEGRRRHRAVLDAALAGVVPLAAAPRPNLSALAHWAD